MPRVAPVSPSDPPVRARAGRPQRIPGPGRFRPALLQRPSARGEFFDIFAADAGRRAPRLGVVVPKRIVRLSSRRNLVKRLVRESFRMKLGDLRPLDWVVRLKRAASPTDRLRLRTELESLWQGLSQ